MRILAIIFLCSCITNAYSQTDSCLQYYPLKIGNVWQYEVDIHDQWPSIPPGLGNDQYFETRTVIGDTLINDRMYFIQRIVDSNDRQSFIYERIDSLSGNLYRKLNNYPEVLIDSLNSQLNDTSKASRHPEDFLNSKCVCTIISDTLIFGESKTYKAFHTTHSIDISQHYLVENIGLVKHIQSFDIGYIEEKLIYAKIGDIQFGNLSLINQRKNLNEKNGQIPVTLLNIYPNPFNSIFRIEFETTNFSNLSIGIYNLLGEEVLNFMYNNLNAGLHSRNIDLSNYTSGVYFLKMSTKNYNKFNRLIYIK